MTPLVILPVDLIREKMRGLYKIAKLFRFLLDLINLPYETK
jgi:hypothetical protein